MTPSDRRSHSAGFTLAEMSLGMGVFSLFMVALFASWTTLQSASVNVMSYAQRQNDQTRVADYLKRDLRRATRVEIWNGAAQVTDTTTFGNELRATVPDYYADSREEDNTHGPSVALAPSLSAGSVVYGTPLVIRYFVQNGAVLREEAGVVRTIAAAAGVFTLQFKAEIDGATRCRVAYNQPMTGGTARFLRRQVDLLCYQRARLQ